jgi:hypothetical protein
MTVSESISRTDLARSTRQAIERARRGQAIFVESYGEEQIAIVDAIDYRLLRAVASYQPDANAPFQDDETYPRGLSVEEVEAAVTQAGGDIQVAWDRVIAAYLDLDISLGRAAERLNLNRFELTARLNRLGLPLRLGPTTVAEARAEYEALQ